jgi:hypothetical protein
MLDILVAHEHQFRPIQTHRLQLQPHLTLTRLFQWPLFNPQTLGPADLMKTNHLWHVRQLSGC